MQYKIHPPRVKPKILLLYSLHFEAPKKTYSELWFPPKTPMTDRLVFDEDSLYDHNIMMIMRRMMIV